MECESGIPPATLAWLPKITYKINVSVKTAWVLNLLGDPVC